MLAHESHTTTGPRREISAATAAALAELILPALIYFGSRRLADFDAALVG